MTEANPQPSAGQSDGSPDRRAGRQAEAGERPTEGRSFGAQQTKDGKHPTPPIPGPDVGLQLQQEAVQAGQEMLRMGQQAASQTAELWRQSLEPFTVWQTGMRRLFDETWGQVSGLGVMRPMQTAHPLAGGAISGLMGAPAADLKEADDAYHLCLEVPGMAAADLKIDVKGGRLAIRGQKTEERHDGGGAYQISERRYGSFERIFPLPAGVDSKKIGVKLEDGLLKINLPKAAPAAGDRSAIEIQN
jgi:HSP20 family molecular chaperone IbpA